MKRVVAIMMLLAVAGVGSAQTWSHRADFWIAQNPNDQWEYGFSWAAGHGAPDPAESLTGYLLGYTPYTVQNPGALPGTGGFGDPETRGWINFEGAASDNDRGVSARWTAATAGTYDVSAWLQTLHPLSDGMQLTVCTLNAAETEATELWSHHATHAEERVDMLPQQVSLNAGDDVIFFFKAGIHDGHNDGFDNVHFDTVVTLAGALTGDANGDGVVDDRDLSLLLANWNQDATGDPDGGWGRGEFNAAAPVEDADLSLLLANWTAASVVPEPASALLLLLGFAAATLRRRGK